MQPGDEILLMSGQYGDIFIGTYGTPTTNSAFVTIAAAPGQTPVLASLRLWAANMWRFQHLSVQSLAKAKQSRLIFVSDQGVAAQLPTSFSSPIVIGAPENVDDWTQADWIAKSHYSGFSAMSGPDGLNTKCVSFTGGKIYGARYAVSLFSHNSVFSHNTIDHFGDDGLDYGANDLHHQRQLRPRQPGYRRRQPPGLHAGFPWADQQSDRAEERQGRFLHRLLECRHRAQPLHPADGSEPQIPASACKGSTPSTATGPILPSPTTWS